MNYYLVKVATIFVDPHGAHDDGGTEKEAVQLNFDIRTDVLYKEQIHKYRLEFLEKLSDEEIYEDLIWKDDDEMEGSYDGYNSTYLEVDYEKITKEQFEEYSKIIENYEML
jgi:hypothetical protein